MVTVFLQVNNCSVLLLHAEMEYGTCERYHKLGPL